MPTDFAFRRHLREANAEELAAVLAARLAELDPPAARAVLRNPFASGETIELLLSVRALVAAYAVRREAAAHPRTPIVLALALVEGLFWNDLVKVGLDTRLHPIVRRAADRRILERLPGLATGEKMAIARSASAGVLAVLRRDPSPRVLGALLENPRLTEGVLLPLVSSESAAPRVLELIAANARWSVRYPIRVALCRNARTPIASALALLPQLKKPDLAAVASDVTLSGPVRTRARLLGGAPLARREN